MGAEISNSFGSGGDQITLAGKPGTNTEGKALANFPLGGGEDFIMDDLVDVVEDEQLGIREEQVQMVKFQGWKERSQEAKKILMWLALMGAVIEG